MVRDRLRDSAVRNLKLQRLLWRIGQAGETGLAITVCADSKLRLSEVEQSVFENDIDAGVINWLACSVFHSEIRPAGADPAIHNGASRGIVSHVRRAQNQKEHCPH